MVRKLSVCLAVLTSVMACSDHSFKGSPAQTTVPAQPAKPVTSDSADIAKTEGSLPTTVDETVTLKDKCEAGVGAQVLEQKISFPARRGCDFEAEGITKVDAMITAMKTSSTSLKLPPGEVCDMSLESDGKIDFRYDDILIFSIENNLLFASTEGLLPHLTKAGDYLQWDKAKLLGLRLDFDGSPLCIDKNASCIMPPTDTPGKLSFNFPFASVGPMIQLYKGKTEVPLLLTASGDNDPSDCSHSQLDLTVKMKYVP